MFYADVIGDCALECLHHGPVVAEPAAVENFSDASQEAFAVSDVRAADVQRLPESGRTPEVRKIAGRGEFFHSCSRVRAVTCARDGRTTLPQCDVDARILNGNMPCIRRRATIVRSSR